MKTTLILPLLFSASLVGFADSNAWTVDSEEEWEQGLASQDELEVKGGMVSPVGEKATFRSVMRSLDE